MGLLAAGYCKQANPMSPGDARFACPRPGEEPSREGADRGIQVGAGMMNLTNAQAAFALVIAIAILIGFAAGYGLRSYISHRRHHRLH